MQKDRTVDSTGDIHPLFLKFWEAYPRKVAKKESLRAFQKLNPDERLLEAMLKAVNRQRDSEEWKRDGGKYVPHAPSWLNGARWEDEVETLMAASKQLTQADHYRNLEGKRREQATPAA